MSLAFKEAEFFSQLFSSIQHLFVSQSSKTGPVPFPLIFLIFDLINPKMVIKMVNFQSKRIQTRIYDPTNFTLEQNLTGIGLNLQRYADPISCTREILWQLWRYVWQWPATSGNKETGLIPTDSLLNHDPWHRYRIIGLIANRHVFRGCFVNVSFSFSSKQHVSPGRKITTFRWMIFVRWIATSPRYSIDHAYSGSSWNSYATAALAFLPNKTFRDTRFPLVIFIFAGENISQNEIYESRERIFAKFCKFF